ncbi:flavin reductase family protein [Streptomyces sp. Wb2n-11]|uniref:flavin reductase family protein n=1 Tax=Streptomyces sp. Wb2n-11 TaxID=1030533 RepID=UPI000B892C15|nr:flavin reductase family protein [Streptomyces sp. Wb2n-11]
MYVVTAAAAGERSGCLVGFASQCSIRPPRFMVWLSTANRTYRVARQASHLGAHLLRREDRAPAGLFGGGTGDRVDKFERVAWQPQDGGTPVLTDVCAWFVGRVLDRFAGGDHLGFLLAPVAESPRPPGRARLLGLTDVADLSPGHPA